MSAGGRILGRAAGLLLTAALTPGAAVASEPGFGVPVDLPGAGNGARLVFTAPGAVAALWHETDPAGSYRRLAHLAELAPSGARETLPGAVDYDADVVTDGAGRAVVVWADSSSWPYRIRMAEKRSRQPLGEPVDVPHGGGSARGVKAALNARGDLIVVYEADGRLKAVFRPAGSDLFGAPVQLSQGDTAGFSGIKAALSASGEAVVAWSEQIWVRECDDAGRCSGTSAPGPVRAATGSAAGFSEPQELWASSVYEMAVGIDAAGGAVVALRAPDGPRSVVAALRPPGGRFGAPQTLGTGGYGEPDVAVAGTGLVLVAYTHTQRHDQTDVTHAGLAVGDTRSGQLGAGQDVGEAQDIRAGVDADGNALVVWRRSDGVTQTVWRDAGGTVGPVRDLACPGDAYPLLQDAVVWGADDAAVVLRVFVQGAERHRLARARGDRSPATTRCERHGAWQGPPPSPLSQLIFGQSRGRLQLMSPPLPAREASTRPPWSDGPSTNIVFSQDNRIVRLAAFDSEGTTLTPGDLNGHRDVFVVRRNPGGGNLTGVVERASVGPGGVEANGPSWQPSLDGETRASPHCVTFQSAATNLHPADQTPDVDVYVRELRRGRTLLVSPAQGDATGATVDGRCETVVFAAGSSVWVTHLASGRTFRLAPGADPDQQTNGEGAVYERGGQVWYRSFDLVRRGSRILLRRGRERLVSDDRRGRRGNGRSSNPVLDDSGHYVAFESTATNLCLRRCKGVSEDRNGAVSDVFRRTLSRRAPTRDSMQMASYSFEPDVQGNGPSNNPVMSAAGENILYDSEATNLRNRKSSRSRDVNGPVRDVHTWTFPRARGYGNVLRRTRATCGEDCRAPSVLPSMSARGNYIGYTSWLSEYCGSRWSSQYWVKDRDCPTFPDVFGFFVGYSHEGYPLG